MDRPGLQKVEAPRISRQWTNEWGTLLSAPRTGTFTPPPREIFLILVAVRG